MLTGENMNANDNVYCCTKGANGNEFFNVQEDACGNSMLTGDGSGKSIDIKTCTIDALETWVITY